jgi:hypothetical protein
LAAGAAFVSRRNLFLVDEVRFYVDPFLLAARRTADLLAIVQTLAVLLAEAPSAVLAYGGGGPAAAFEEARRHLAARVHTRLILLDPARAAPGTVGDIPDDPRARGRIDAGIPA